MKEIDSLFKLLDKFLYPDTMVPIKGEIIGTAFFPGGKGIIDNGSTISNKRIMILGQDFDCEVNYQLSVKNGKEDLSKNPTWRNILAFLKELNIPLEKCFFTNSILGARKSKPCTGKSPAFKDECFIKNCQNFFLESLNIQKPKAIFVLGKYVAEFLAPLALDLKQWRKIPNYKSIDRGGCQVKRDVIFTNNIKTNVVLLTHPSFRNSNVYRRSFGKFLGHQAELKMVDEVLR